MKDLLILHVAKISKVIKSCETDDQLDVSKKIINNFIIYWRCKRVNPVVIQKYIVYLTILYNAKKKSLNYD